MGKARFHYDNVYMLHPLCCGNFDVRQVGDLYCGQDYAVPGHRQNCFEFSLIVSGKAVFSINEENYTVRKGDLILNTPDDYHAIRSDNFDPMRMVYIGFSVGKEVKADPRYLELEKRLRGVGERIVPGQQELSASFFKLLNEMHQNEDFSSELTEVYVNEIIILACRSFLGKERHRQYIPATPVATADGLVYDIISLLDSQTMRIDHLSSIGEKFGYSYSYLSQVFSKKVGMSITDYFHLRLFENAVQTLYEGASVTAVAEKLGYTSIHNFSRAFTNYFGVPPTRFREIDSRWMNTGRTKLELAKSRVTGKDNKPDNNTGTTR